VCTKLIAKRSRLSKIPDFRVGVDVKRILIVRGIGYSFDETTPPGYSLFTNFYQDEYAQISTVQRYF
jgi:hypothetical protein